MRRVLFVWLTFIAKKAQAALQFGPYPTFEVAEAALLSGNEPKPIETPGPDIRKRQSPSPKTECGYLDGSSEYPWTCGGGSICGYNTVHSWWGCCAGESYSTSTWIVTGCTHPTSCLESQSIFSCGSACLSDTLILKCTDDGYPYCATNTLIPRGLTLLDCAEKPSIHLNFAATPLDGPSMTITSTSVQGTSAVPNPNIDTASLQVPSSVSQAPNPNVNTATLTETQINTVVSVTTPSAVNPPVSSTTPNAASPSIRGISNVFEAWEKRVSLFVTALGMAFLIV